MFTGIVEELAQIKSIKPKSKGIRYAISAEVVVDDLKIGDSISVNGVCLTIVKRGKDSFCMDLVEETLNKSNLGLLVLPGVWAEQKYIQENTVLTVLCDQRYAEDDYIREYEEFLNFVNS